MSLAPSTNGDNGRGADGRFVRGNGGGPGHPLAGAAAKLRSALMRAVSPEDIQELAKGLLEKAKAGNVPAATLVLNYTIGKPVEHDLIERIERLECEANGEPEWAIEPAGAAGAEAGA